MTNIKKVLMGKNLPIVDSITLSLLFYLQILKWKIVAPFIYNGIYSNSFGLMKNILRANYPLKATLKADRTEVLFNNHSELTLFTSNMKRIYAEKTTKIEYDISTDVVKFDVVDVNSNRKRLIFNRGLKNGDVFSIFFDNVYHSLPAEGRTVIDIGSNTGDSSIYFALRGAAKVIGFEPFPKLYDTAISNILINDLTETVIIELAALGKNHGIANVSSDTIGDVYSSLSYSGNSFPTGANVRQIPVKTLEDVVNKYGIEGGVMKVDCEGCEYDLILFAPEKVLAKFSHIQIEYHDGYVNLKKKLEKSGFNVIVDRPKLAINPIDKKRKYSYGYLYAIKQRT